MFRNSRRGWPKFMNNTCLGQKCEKRKGNLQSATRLREKLWIYRGGRHDGLASHCHIRFDRGGYAAGSLVGVVAVVCHSVIQAGTADREKSRRLTAAVQVACGYSDSGAQ